MSVQSSEASAAAQFYCIMVNELTLLSRSIIRFYLFFSEVAAVVPDVDPKNPLVSEEKDDFQRLHNNFSNVNANRSSFSFPESNEVRRMIASDVSPLLITFYCTLSIFKISSWQKLWRVYNLFLLLTY